MPLRLFWSVLHFLLYMYLLISFRLRYEMNGYAVWLFVSFNKAYHCYDLLLHLNLFFIYI